MVIDEQFAEAEAALQEKNNANEDIHNNIYIVEFDGGDNDLES